MIVACMFLIRVDLACKFTNTYLVPKPTPFLRKKCCLFHGLNNNWKIGSEKDMESVTNRRKSKAVTTVWKPVCTQSSSHEEYMVKDAKVDLGSQHNLDVAGKTEVECQVTDVHYRMSNSVLNTEHAKAEAAVVNKLVNSNYSSPDAQESDEGRSAEGGSMPSTEKKYTIRIEAAAALIQFIKGQESSTLKKIEEEMGVQIKFPWSKKEDYIIIEGISAESVARALEKLQVLINEAIKSPALDYTHFVSLPLAIHQQLVEKLVKFQNSILGIKNADQVRDLDNDGNGDTSDEEDRNLQFNRAPTIAVKLKAQEDSESSKVDISNIPLVSYPPEASKSSTSEEKTPALSELGIDKSIFIKPNTFHLTVLMLKLYNKDLVDAAAKVLQSLSSKVTDALDSRPVTIRLKGLECMKGSLAKARVLYVPVEEIGGEDRLLRACQVIIDSFVEAGLVLEKDAQQKLKLHATLMNARHRKRWKRTRKVDSFDARGIFKKFGSEEWGEYLIHEAHLSQRFVFDENGYYHCCASIPFPVNMQID